MIGKLNLGHELMKKLRDFFGEKSRILADDITVKEQI